MSRSTNDPNLEADRDPHDEPNDDAAGEPVVPGDERRGIGEWAVVLVLVALIVGVAWSQFGSLFDTSTAGSEGAPPEGLTVEGEGIEVGGTAMSQLSDPGPRVAPHGERTEHDDHATPRPLDDEGASDERDPHE